MTSHPSSLPQAPEVISVSTLAVHCDGSGGPLGHPRVFLHIETTVGEVVCPYCSRIFQFTGDYHEGH